MLKLGMHIFFLSQYANNNCRFIMVDTNKIKDNFTFMYSRKIIICQLCRPEGEKSTDNEQICMI